MRLRRRLAMVMAFAVLFAGFAQAAHHHQDDLAQGADTHLQCVLCLYSAGTATPPAPLLPPTLAATYHSIPIRDAATVWPDRGHRASYDARGPPRV